MRIEINGHRLNVVQQGPENGQAVVLLHHGLGAAQSWQEVQSALAGAGYHVTAYDRWGYGASDPRPFLELPGFAPDVADLASLLERLGLRRPVLVGHSDGGTIALYLATRLSAMLAGLVTVAAHIYVEPKMIPGMQALRQAYDQNPAFHKGLRRLHGNQAEAVFENWYQGWQAAHARGLAAWDMRPLLGQITCPALVVQGDADEHATPQHARDLADNLPGAQLWLVPGGSHLLPQDSPEIFVLRLVKFLKGVLE